MKKNVCAYARVSTNAKAQEHSFEFQKAYWTETLSSSEEFNFVGMYADKGISGKTSFRRPQFMKMITAAKNKQIDIIFCKSVQRFARNTSELLDYVRQLRDVGVAVIFEKEHINTLESESDMYLTVAAAIAETIYLDTAITSPGALRISSQKVRCRLVGDYMAITLNTQKSMR